MIAHAGATATGSGMGVATATPRIAAQAKRAAAKRMSENKEYISLPSWVRYSRILLAMEVLSRGVGEILLRRGVMGMDYANQVPVKYSRNATRIIPV
jgi:hypothetical protein